MTGAAKPPKSHPTPPFGFTVEAGHVTINATQAPGYTTRWNLTWGGDLVGHVHRRPEGGYQARLGSGLTARAGAAVEAVERLCQAMQRKGRA